MTKIGESNFKAIIEKQNLGNSIFFEKLVNLFHCEILLKTEPIKNQIKQKHNTNTQIQITYKIQDTKW